MGLIKQPDMLVCLLWLSFVTAAVNDQNTVAPVTVEF